MKDQSRRARRAERDARLLTREMAARGCESALWLAILSGQLAGLDEAFVSHLVVLHADAGRQRRELEAIADHAA